MMDSGVEPFHFQPADPMEPAKQPVRATFDGAVGQKVPVNTADHTYMYTM